MNSLNIKISTLLFIFLLLFLSLSSPSSSTKGESDELVDTICHETINYTKCLEALGSDPRTKNTTNLKDLANVTLQLSVSNAKDSLCFINKIIKSNESDQPEEVAALKQCAFWYEAVVASFRSALVELKEDVTTANYDIKVASDDADYCENELVSRKAEVPCVSERNNQVKLYSSIGFVITNKLP